MSAGSVPMKDILVVRNGGRQYGTAECIRFRVLEHRLRKYRNEKGIRFLKRLLTGKGILCLIRERDPRGVLEADVYPLGQ